MSKLEIRDLHVSVEGKEILKGVNLSLSQGEVHALMGLVLICVAYWRKIRLEEDYLGQLFGADYDEYRSATHAVVPGVW